MALEQAAYRSVGAPSLQELKARLDGWAAWMDGQPDVAVGTHSVSP